MAAKVLLSSRRLFDSLYVYLDVSVGAARAAAMIA